MSHEFVYLDTETTGLDPEDEEIVEIAIADDDGHMLINTLVRPRRRRRWPEAQAIHGIGPDDVVAAPTLNDLVPQIRAAIADRTLVIYNAAYDVAFVGNRTLDIAADIQCCMLRFAEFVGEINPYYNSYKWHRLSVAAAVAGHDWAGTDAHRAAADALACRTVWHYLERLQRPQRRPLPRYIRD